MDDKDFKKHLRDLVHGHHNPAEHDWSASGRVTASQAPRAKRSARPKATGRKRSK
ncbi:MAG TPA: hypothetical protein VJ732_00660 [Bryobacteraceae bacterium]|nr:hypothetical protein [Bryobacteraceae bacterium]